MERYRGGWEGLRLKQEVWGVRRLLGSELRTPGLHRHSHAIFLTALFCLIPRPLHSSLSHTILSLWRALASSSLLLNTLSKRSCLCRTFHATPSCSHTLSPARQRASGLGTVAYSALWLVPSTEQEQQPQSGHWEKPVLVVDSCLCWPRGQGPRRLEE